MSEQIRQVLREVAFSSPEAVRSVEGFASSHPFEEIVDAFSMHRLIGRLSKQLNAIPVPADSELSEITGAITQRQSAIEARGSELMMEIARIQQHLESLGQRSILLKGPSAHLASGGAIPLRSFADIDLLVYGTKRSNVSTIVGPLEELGYHHIPEWPCGIHEAGHFVRGDSPNNFTLDGRGLKQESVKLDVHHCFPAWGYPDSPVVDLSAPGRIDLDPQGGGERIDRHLIDYEDMLPEVRIRDTPSGRITALSTEATALVSCANVFKDDLKPHWIQPHTVRLGEIAEILELVTQPHFDTGRFRSLAGAWSTQDAVHFVGNVCKHFDGSTPEALLTSMQEEAAHYLTIWNRDHYPVAVRAATQLNSFDNRVVQYLTMKDYCAALGETAIDVEGIFTPQASIIVGGEGSRSFTHRTRGREIEMSVSFAWTPGHLAIRATIKNPDPLGSECVLLNFGEPALEIYRPAPGGNPRVRNRAESGTAVERLVEAAWTDAAKAPSLSVRIPWQALPDGRGSAGEISLICGLQDHVVEDHGKNSSVFAPVRLKKS